MCDGRGCRPAGTGPFVGNAADIGCRLFSGSGGDFHMGERAFQFFEDGNVAGDFAQGHTVGCHAGFSVDTGRRGTEKDAKGVAGRPERHFADVEDVAQRVAVVIDAPGQFPVIFVAPAAHADFLGEGLSQAAGSVVVVQFDVKCGGADSDDHGFLSSGFGFAARAGKTDRPA
mgnify:FL=1